MRTASLVVALVLLATGFAATPGCSEDSSKKGSGEVVSPEGPAAKAAPAKDPTPAPKVEPAPGPTLEELRAAIGEKNQFGIPTHVCCEVEAACCSIPGCCDLSAKTGDACMSPNCPKIP